MKLLSSAVLYAAAFFGSHLTAADSIEHRQTAPVLPAEELAPCNGAPEQYDMPVNYFPWLGTCDVGADSENIKDLMYKGIRLLDLKLCKQSQGKHMAVCSADGEPSAMRWQDVLDPVLDFARAEPEQIIVINLDLKEQDVETMEDDLDAVCKVHAERTEGTKLYEPRECPFVYTLKFPAMSWPSLGELVNYDPQMAQWEGDGELVGVRSKVILTYNGNMLPRHRTSYLSKKFWTTVELEEKDTAERLNELCSSANAVGLKGEIKPKIWENALFEPSSCNINEASAKTFINVLLTNSVNDKLLYLRNLQSLLVPVNYAKWQGRDKTVLPTTNVEEHEHDEL